MVLFVLFVLYQSSLMFGEKKHLANSVDEIPGKKNNHYSVSGSSMEPSVLLSDIKCWEVSTFSKIFLRV